MTSNRSQLIGPERSPHLGGAQFEELSLIYNQAIPSDLSVLDDVVAEITEAIDRPAYWGDVEGIGLAVREALANAILHGNHCEPERTVGISVAVDENCDLLIIVKDSGPGFDPSRLQNPIASGNLLADHGRGIFLMKQFMDEVEFKFDHGTEVDMRRWCQWPE